MVIDFDKKSMLYSHYTWDRYEESDPRISGRLQDIAFNRKSGPEVLHLIRVLMILWGLETKEGGQKIERMIHNYLPTNITTQYSVKTWIILNWKFY